MYRGNAVGEVSALEEVRRLGGGIRTSVHIAAVAAKDQDAIIRRGSARDAVAPIWRGATFIHDTVTKAATGEVKTTVMMFGDYKVLRTDGWAARSSKSRRNRWATSANTAC